MSLLDISDFNPNLFGKPADTERKEEEEEDVDEDSVNDNKKHVLFAAGGNSSSSESEDDIPLSQRPGHKLQHTLTSSSESDKPVTCAGDDQDSSEDEDDDERNKKKGFVGRKAAIRDMMDVIDDDPELWGVRRSSRSRKEPQRLEVGYDEDSDDEGSRSHRVRRKRGHSMTAVHNSGYSGPQKRQRKSAGQSNSDEDDDNDSYESDDYRPQHSRKSQPMNRKQLRNARISTYKEVSSDDDSGGDRRRKRKNATGSSSSLVAKPSNKLHPMLRTAADIPTDRSNTYQFGSSRVSNNRPLRKFTNSTPTTNVAHKASKSDSEEESGEPSQEELEARLSNSDFLAPCVEDNEGIERVLNYRFGRKGATGDKTTFYNIQEETNPNHGFDASSEEGELQLYIKWRGWSHLHNTWESMESLAVKSVDGLKKIHNFKQRIEEIHDWKKTAFPEELEAYNYQEEVNENLLNEHRILERIVAHSKPSPGGYSDYYCKWTGLPYSECSWEDGELVIKLFADIVKEYEQRVKSQCLPNKSCKVLKYRPKFQQLKEQPDYLAPDNPNLILRDYQLTGINWLYHSWARGHSSILADEMGLGKTVQTIGFLSVLFQHYDCFGPFLLVVPLSTIVGWKREFLNWAPQFNLVIYLGDVDSRQIIRSYEWQMPNRRLKFNVCLTTYEILLKDRSFLGSVSWAVLGVDEAHRLKNDDSLLYKTLIDFDTNHRLLITGTPLQNSLRELWALLHFVQPDKFDDWEDFEEDYSDHEKGFVGLHKELEPYLLRRVKKDVERSLPPKTENILRVEMSRVQKQIYKWILTRNYRALNKPNAFLNLIMELKKCCNHTHLIHPNQPEWDQLSRDERLSRLIRGSGKVLLLDKLLWNLREGGHRVLIFSQMVMMLDVLSEYLTLRNWSFQRLDGTIRGETRKRALDAFNAETSPDFCFLLSTRAGGLGVNLATADTVIIFDSDWNPQNDLQAMARCHRIGQTKQVRVYRLILKNSVEEDIVERAKQKMVLEHLVIHRMDTTGRIRQGDSSNPFSKEELSSILKFGAEDLFKESEGDETEAEVDLDAILKSAETRDETVATSVVAEELLSQFKVVNLENLEDSEIIMTASTEGRRKGQAQATSKSWSEIIPEDKIRKLEQEEAEEKLLQLELGPRQRKQVKPLNVGVEDEEELSDREIRALVKAVRKYGCALERIDSIVEEAELQEKSEGEVKRLVEAILQGCEKAVRDSEKLANKIKQETDAATDEDSSLQQPTKKLPPPSFTLGRVAIPARPLLQAQHDLLPLHKEIPSDREARRKYRVDFFTKTVSWDCVWDEIDDSNLLIGIYEYGMDSWDSIKEDPDLGLRAKILRDHNLKPQAGHLRTRADYLLRLLKKKLDGTLVRDGEHTSKPKSSVIKKPKSATSAKEKSLAASRATSSQPKSAEFVESSDSSSSDNENAQSKPSNATSKATSEKTEKKARKNKRNNQPVHLTVQQNKKTSAASVDPASTTSKLPDDVFNDCKERMRPVRKALKKLQNSESDRDLLGSHLVKIGDHIGVSIRKCKRDEDVRIWRNRLWIFVSYFTELSHSELHHLYKKLRKDRRQNSGSHSATSLHHHNHDSVKRPKMTDSTSSNKLVSTSSTSSRPSGSSHLNSFSSQSHHHHHSNYNNAYNRRPGYPPSSSSRTYHHSTSSYSNNSHR